MKTKKAEKTGNKTKEIEEVKSKVSLDKLTVRQYFYTCRQLNKETLIKTLERTHGERLKSFDEWKELLESKNINF